MILVILKLHKENLEIEGGIVISISIVFPWIHLNKMICLKLWVAKCFHFIRVMYQYKDNKKFVPCYVTFIFLSYTWINKLKSFWMFIVTLQWYNQGPRKYLRCSTACKVSQYGVISGPHFPAFELNTERYFVSLRIQSEYGKIRTRNNSVSGHFWRSGELCNNR